MIAEALKKALLQAAIQGKLTEQLPGDGDARDLLKDIQKEKTRQIKEGKIKKGKSLPDITEDEIPFDIPESWTWSRLGDLSIFINGDRGKNYTGRSSWINSGVPFINAGSLNNTYLTDELINFISESDYQKLRSGKISIGDILYCLRGSLGKFSINSIYEKGTIGSSLVIVRPVWTVLTSYLGVYLLTPLAQEMIQRFVNGTAQPNLAAESVRSYLIPLPPIAEQQRIVEQLEKIFIEIAALADDEIKLERLEKTFPDHIRASMLHAAIQGKLTEQLPEDGDARDLLKEIQKEKARLIKEGKLKKANPLPEITEDEIPFDIPVNWAWVRLGDANVITMGQSPDGSSVGKNDGIEFHQGKIFFTDKFLDDSELRCNKPKKIAQAGSILLCVRAPVGVVNVTNREICIGRGLTAINPFSAIDREFLYYYLITLKGYFVEKSTGSTFKAISQNTISAAPIPIPPLEEQRRIVEKLEVLLPLCESLE